MDAELAALLYKKGFNYQLVDSDQVSDEAGNIVSIKDYYPDSGDKGIGLSIALSSISEKWEPKCWLSIKIENTSDNSKPKYHPSYGEFEYNGIHYYPYSIAIQDMNLSQIFNICEGLYEFVLMDGDRHG